jgi:hypothetical protein
MRELAVEGTGPGFSAGCGRLAAFGVVELDLCGLVPRQLSCLWDQVGWLGFWLVVLCLPELYQGWRFCFSLNCSLAVGELCC